MPVRMSESPGVGMSYVSKLWLCLGSGEARMKKLVLPLWNERKKHKRGSQKFSKPCCFEHSMESTHFQIAKVDIYHLLHL